MKLADAISCYAFTRDIRTMSVKEAIALGKIKPPKKIKLQCLGQKIFSASASEAYALLNN